jgi:hypothetical protein
MFQSDRLDIVPRFVEALSRAARSMSAKQHKADIDAYKQHVPNRAASTGGQWLDIRPKSKAPRTSPGEG